MTHEYAVGDRVEAIIPFSEQWHTGLFVNYQESRRVAMIRFDGVRNCVPRSFDQIRPLPAAEPAPKPDAPESCQLVDPEHLRLMEAVCEAALKLPDDEIPTGGAFDKAVYQLALHRTPKPPRCEPPKEHWNESYHFLICDEDLVVAEWNPEKQDWYWLGSSGARSSKGLGEKGWIYHSVAKPAPVWLDDEIKQLCGALSSGWTGFDRRAPHSAHLDAQQYLRLARALLSGDKSLIEGKS
jgi:hypothetical protein